MTIGPEPKLIRTGSTLHTVCVTHGPLSTYKLFAIVHGGKYDEDINRHHKHTVAKLKMISLYSFMIDPFKHNGHYVVMDSAYMSDDMCQMGREEWKINSFHVMAVNKRPLFGPYYSEGHILIKNWTKRFLLRHNSTSFKRMCFLTRLKVVPDGLYGPHLHCEPGQ
jgi:hypothetical protein